MMRFERIYALMTLLGRRLTGTHMYSLLVMVVLR